MTYGSERKLRESRTFVVEHNITDGVRWSKTTIYDEGGKVGTTVDSPCHCLGLPIRTHSDIHWLAKRKVAA